MKTCLTFLLVISFLFSSGYSQQNNINGMSGTYTIDKNTGDFLSFGAAINALIQQGVSGAVTFNVSSGYRYTEQLVLPSINGASETNRITFRQFGSGSKPIIEFAGSSYSFDAIIQLDGADYITFDGFDLQSYRFGNYVEYGIYVQALTENSCKNNVFKNIDITLAKTNANSIGVYLKSHSGVSNDNNKFYNLSVKDCHSGYIFEGNSLTLDKGNEIGILQNGTSIIDNLGGGLQPVYGIKFTYQKNSKIFNTNISDIVSHPATPLNAYAIFLSGAESTTDVYNNIIDGVENSSFINKDAYGIFVGSGQVFNIYSNIIRNINAAGNAYGIYLYVETCDISRNKISNINSYRLSDFSAYGIYFEWGNNASVYNNFIWDIIADSSRSLGGVGLYLNDGDYYKIYFNSVLVSYESYNPTNYSYALFSTTLPNLIDMRNNIFANLSDNGTRAAAFGRNGSDLSNIKTTSDYNLYYAGIPAYEHLIYYDGEDADYTLAEYKARVGNFDQNSVTENPPFESTTELHIDSTVATKIEGGGRPITTPFAIDSDIDSEVRNSTRPDIGADEGHFVKITSLNETDFADAKEFMLQQNYPNPFNPTTQINFSIPVNGNVLLKLYDILGKEIAELINEQKSAGSYQYNFNAANLSSGVYIYKLQSGAYSASRKFLLIK